MPDPGNEKLIKKTTLKRVSKFNHGLVTGRRVQKKKMLQGILLQNGVRREEEG